MAEEKPQEEVNKDKSYDLSKRGDLWACIKEVADEFSGPGPE